MISAFVPTKWIIIWVMQMVSHSVLTLSDVSHSTEEFQCLDNITAEDIPKTNNSTTYLCIANTSLPQLQEGALSRFYNLSVLILINVSLNEVSPSAFAGLYNLTKLDLTGNSISTLPSSTFLSNQKLQELSLARNNISKLKDIMPALSALPSLRCLNLSGNSIKMIEGKDIELPKLEVLSLKGCELTSFASSSLPALTTLHLENNYLNSEVLDLSGFNASTTLRELYLGNPQAEQTGSNCVYNYFPVMKSAFFPSLPSLRLLDLQNSDVASISSSTFNEIPKLETLILRSNKLPTIPSAITTSLTRLKIFDMSYNGRKEIYFDIQSVNFSRLQSLEHLNLSDTQLYQLPADAFNGLRNLINLSLESSELNEIKPYAFRTLRSLLLLDLSNNHLAVILNDTFADLVSLTHLKLFRNSLKIYKENHPFLPTISLQKLEFQYNSLCELWDYLIQHLSNLTYLDMSHNKIVQWRWNGFPTSGSLKYANFGDNEISVITQPMLKNLLSLELGVLSNNPYNCTDCEIANVRELLKSPIYSPYKDGYRCQNKYRKNEDFVFNSTLPSWCYPNSFNYVGAGIGAGFLFIFALVITSLSYHFRWYIRYRWFVARCHLKNWHKPLQRKQLYLYDAFISYSDKDCYWLKNEFLPRLENDFQFHFCVHERDFEPGRNITDNIFEGIDRSKMFIAILTENFLASQWCMWEMNMAISKMAIEQSDNLVIIKLHTISRDKLTRPIQYLMKTKTYLGWPVTPIGQRLFWERLIHILKKCTSNTGATANPA